MSLPANDPLINASTITLAAYSANWIQFNTFNSGAFNVGSAGAVIPITAGSAAVAAYWNADSFPNDQFSSLHWQTSAGSSAAFGGPCVRVSSGSGGSFYWWAIQADGAKYLLRRTLNGTQTDLIGLTANTFAGGDILKLVVIGTVLTLYQNGTQLTFFNDSSGGVASGAAGFQAFATASAQSGVVSSWIGGASTSSIDTLLGQGWV